MSPKRKRTKPTPAGAAAVSHVSDDDDKKDSKRDTYFDRVRQDTAMLNHYTPYRITSLCDRIEATNFTSTASYDSDSDDEESTIPYGDRVVAAVASELLPYYLVCPVCKTQNGIVSSVFCGGGASDRRQCDKQHVWWPSSSDLEVSAQLPRDTHNSPLETYHERDRRFWGKWYDVAQVRMAKMRLECIRVKLVKMAERYETAVKLNEELKKGTYQKIDWVSAKWHPRNQAPAATASSSSSSL